jgi:type I restriction enzyme S subunit
MIRVFWFGVTRQLRPNPDRIDARYLVRMLDAPQIRQIIETGARSTSGVHNVNSVELASLQIPLPEISEQHEIVRRVEEAFTWLDKVAAEHVRAAHLLPKLDQAILSKAFRGELVPQDPNDEPAAVLLARIRAARGEQPKQQRGRKSRDSSTPRAPKEAAAMTKSRQDDDVKEKPYLAGLLRQAGGVASTEDLFKRSELPVTDFYKQLAWEINAGHI